MSRDLGVGVEKVVLIVVVLAEVDVVVVVLVVVVVVVGSADILTLLQRVPAWLLAWQENSAGSVWLILTVS